MFVFPPIFLVELQLTVLVLQSEKKVWYNTSSVCTIWMTVNEEKKKQLRIERKQKIFLILW